MPQAHTHVALAYMQKVYLYTVMHYIPCRNTKLSIYIYCKTIVVIVMMMVIVMLILNIKYICTYQTLMASKWGHEYRYSNGCACLLACKIIYNSECD